MPDTTPPTLTEVVCAAIGFAREAGHFHDDLGPGDFAIQRSEPGTTHATYADSTHLMTVTFDRTGVATTRIAALAWNHNPPEGQPHSHVTTKHMPELRECHRCGRSGHLRFMKTADGFLCSARQSCTDRMRERDRQRRDPAILTAHLPADVAGVVE